MARKGEPAAECPVAGRNYAGSVPDSKPDPDRTLITSAGRSRTLDIDARNRRYLITMVFRTAFFLAFLVVPGWWKIACLVGATVLPAVAVLLANASDHRPPPIAAREDEGTDGLAALSSNAIIKGTIEE